MSDKYVIEDPRISMHQLIRYLAAAPTERRSILKGQRYLDAGPEPFGPGYYKEAIAVLLEHICERAEKTNKLAVEISHLMQAHTAAPRQPERTRLWSCIQAIVEIATAAEDFLACLDGLSPRKLSACGSDHVEIEAVSVGLRPEFELLDKKGNVVGLGKLHVSSITMLRRDDLETVACLLYEYSGYKSHHPIKRKHCVAIDAFTPAIACAPSSYKRKLHDVSAACKEIKALWPTI